MLHFIIPEYGFRETTQKLIKSIQQNVTIENEIWVGDGSFYHNDAMVINLARVTDNCRVHLLTYQDNTGYAATTNQIVRDAEPQPGDYLALCNNDVLIHPGCIELLIQVASGGELAGPSIITPPAYCGPGAHVQMHAEEEDLSGIEVCSMISTCLMILRYEDWLLIGGIDEDFRHYFTDDALCIEAAKHGILSVWVRDAWINHEVGVSFRGWKFANEQVERAIDQYSRRNTRTSNGLQLGITG